MPGFDGTGPMGQGPRTGGGFGYCPPSAGPAYGTYGQRALYGVGRGGFPFGGGRGRAWGGGRGFRWRVNPVNYGWANPVTYGTAPTAENEMEYLKNMLTGLEEEMTAVKKRIDEIKEKE